jgi:hypothetical protein
MTTAQQKVERKIVKTIITKVHNESTRLTDSSQRALHLIIRKRIPSSAVTEKFDAKELDAYIAKFARDIHANAPEQPDSGKRVRLRQSLIEKITDLFSDIWPFGE